MWLTFAPIPHYTAAFYGISLDQVDWFSISYFVVSLLIGFVAIGVLDVFGLRISVSICLIVFYWHAYHIYLSNIQLLEGMNRVPRD